LKNEIEKQIALAEDYFRNGQIAMAETLLRHVIARKAVSKAHELLAYICGNRGELDACEALLRKASALPGASAEAIFYLGRIELQRGRAQDAVASFERSIAMAGAYFEALHELGVAHVALGNHARALIAFKAAEKKKPGSPELHFNIGRSLEEMRRFDEALAHYDKALQLDAEAAHVWANRGVALAELQRHQEALASYDRAMAMEPGDVLTLMNKATTLNELKQHRQALACLDQVRELAPDTDYLQGHWVHTKMLACDWRGLEQALAELIDSVDRGAKASLPFPLLATPASPSTLLASARLHANDKHPARPLKAFPPRADNQKIRLGYFSADFHEHATAQLMAGLFERHDRDRFELFAYSWGPRTKDAMQHRLMAAFDHFVDVSAHSDEEVASMARTAGVDIAVDLKGFTKDCRPGIFAHRAAPLQINYLGYPGSMGCDYIDYVVADETLIRLDDFESYAEKVLLLPNSYQANDDTKPIAPTATTRAEHGLPDQGVVFACFNNNYKITPALFDVWMRVLSKVPGSVLWLLRGNEDACEALQAEAAARNVDPARLVWADHVALPEHLARHTHADLFLDTLHYNAHTTCSDALWAGLPVLTMAGPTFASRVSASLLKACGLYELITHTVSDYEELALSLAASPGRLAEVRDRLMASRTECPLFDTALFAKRLEAGLHAMWARHRQGMAPDHIRVTDDMVLA
jgi:protein O-GlcNAc transferase